MKLSAHHLGIVLAAALLHAGCEDKKATPEKAPEKAPAAKADGDKSGDKDVKAAGADKKDDKKKKGDKGEGSCGEGTCS